MASLQNVVPNLWFEDDAEAAVLFYCDLFGGRELSRTTFPEGAPGPTGKVLTIVFEILGLQLVAINGFATREYTDAVSLAVLCDTQDEIDRYWDGMLAGGGRAQMCGWICDHWGLRWQIVPRGLPKLMAGDDPGPSARVFASMMSMVKLDWPVLQAAAHDATG